MSAFTIILGVTNLLRVSLMKIFIRSKEWYGKLALLISFFVTLLAGALGGHTGTVFSYIFNNIYIPITSSIFALLVFFYADGYDK